MPVISYWSSITLHYASAKKNTNKWKSYDVCIDDTHRTHFQSLFMNLWIKPISTRIWYKAQFFLLSSSLIIPWGWGNFPWSVSDQKYICRHEPASDWWMYTQFRLFLYRHLIKFFGSTYLRSLLEFNRLANVQVTPLNG